MSKNSLPTGRRSGAQQLRGIAHRSERALALIGVLCFCLAPVIAHAGLASVQVEDLNGQRVAVQPTAQTKAIVFLFVSVECPISNSYAPEYRRLAAEFTPKNIEIKLVYPNPDESVQAIKQHLKDYDLSLPALRDTRHELVKEAGVHATPEAAVFVPKSGFVYHGRIDNRYAQLGVARPEATEHDLRDVLTAIVNGKSVPRKQTRAVGCSIAPLR